MHAPERKIIERRMIPRRVFSSLPRFIKKSIYAIVHAKRISDWNKKGNPVPPPHAIKQKNILDYGKRYGCTTLVETGTFMGDMIEAVQYDFKKIYSIELVEFIRDLTMERFKNKTNIEILLGDSSVMLAKVVKQLTEPALFWLDGHYSGGDTGIGEKVCPIYGEMDAVLASPYPHVILIDDARCFNGQDDYPTIEELASYMKKQERESNFEVKDDIIRIILT